MFPGITLAEFVDFKESFKSKSGMYSRDIMSSSRYIPRSSINQKIYPLLPLGNSLLSQIALNRFPSRSNNRELPMEVYLLRDMIHFW